MKINVLLLLTSFILLSGCTGEDHKMTFGEELEFLNKHVEIVVLSDASGEAQVIVSPELQGRVLTSSAMGFEGLSYGWINHELIASGKILKHINPFGGEDRFWLGPEGGQYSIFFKKGDPFDLEHWQTPAVFDTEAFAVSQVLKDRILMTKDMSLTNYSDTRFDVLVEREVRILSREEALEALGVTAEETVKVVAFESINRIENNGKKVWTKENGLLSIWILGMFNPSPATTVVIPFERGDEAGFGSVVNDAYFGAVPPDRLVIKEGVLFFSGDGEYRSKIGLSPQRAKPVLGSYDAANGVLTFVTYTKPEGAHVYVNSMWELQDAPYAGDVINSYNDGPPEPGAKPLGPFYELETSSPAASLNPGEKMEHVHRTFHFQGDETALDVIAGTLLGVSLDEIVNAFE
ncbi:MAG: DUF6786 family protein [candidate division KSB1 bacterium]|jgi:hypothetical protein|nr:DUF6786 family protein [candidate division KSB1 bacterium]